MIAQLFLAVVTTPGFWTILGLICVPLFVALNGIFVAAEFSLVALRKTQVEEMSRHELSGINAVREATANLDRSIAATQLGITLASLALGWIGEPAVAQLISPIFHFLPGAWSAVAIHTTASGIAF